MGKATHNAMHASAQTRASNSTASRCPHVAHEIASLVREIETAHRVWVALADTATDAREAVEGFVTPFGVEGLGMPPDAVAKLVHLVCELEDTINAEHAVQARKDDALNRLSLRLGHPPPVVPVIAPVENGPPNATIAACWSVSDAVDLYFREGLDNVRDALGLGEGTRARELTAAFMQGCAAIQAAETQAKALDRLSASIGQLAAAQCTR